MERRGQFADTDFCCHRHDSVPNSVVQISVLQINTRLAHNVVIASPVHVHLFVHRGNLTHVQHSHGLYNIFFGNLEYWYARHGVYTLERPIATPAILSDIHCCPHGTRVY